MRALATKALWLTLLLATAGCARTGCLVVRQPLPGNAPARSTLPEKIHVEQQLSDEFLESEPQPTPPTKPAGHS